MALETSPLERAGVESGIALEWSSDVEVFAFNTYMASRVSSLDKRLELVDVAARALDSILESVKSPLYSEAMKIVDYPLLDIFEVVDALGWQNLARILKNAMDAVKGVGRLSESDVAVISDLLGWSERDATADPRVLGYAVILSITASFNKALNNLANTINEQ
ncbi:MAG: hypothetical protein QXS85_06020 [Acidilobaceae archaeon]